MKCPNCENIILEGKLKCELCNYNVHLFSQLQSLKKESINVTQNLRTNIAKSENIKAKISNIEVQILQYMKKESKAKEEIIIPQATKEKNIKPAIPFKTTTNKIEIKKEAHTSEVQFGQKWLLIIGIVILVLGIGYFLKYSFDQNWVNPIVRVSGVFLTGAALLFAGDYFRKKLSQNFGLYLTGGGIATLYFASFAAFNLYKLPGQVPSFLLMILITCITCALALLYNTKWLALLGLIGGFFTPIILSTGQDAQIALMSYMVLLNIGILILGLYKQWGTLNNWGFLCTWLLYSGWFSRHYISSKFLPSFIFLNIFFLIYATVPFLYYLKQKRQEKLKGLTITIFNSFISFGFAFAMIKPKFGVQYVSLVSISYTALFIYMASLLYKRSKDNIEPLALVLSKATLFLVVTIPLLFSGHWITIFWMVQSFVLFYLAGKIKHQNLYRGAFILLIITLFKFLFYDYSVVFKYALDFMIFRKSFTFLLTQRLLNEFFTLTLLFYIGKTTCNWVLSKKNDLSSNFQWKLIFTIFGALLFIILNIETKGFFQHFVPKASFAAVSVLWALFASGLITLGFIKRVSALRKCALILYALTIMKVFFKDMANVSTPFRILSFLVLGILLIIASYLYYRFKDRIAPEQTKEKVS